MNNYIYTLLILFSSSLAIFAEDKAETKTIAMKDIKSYCIDFNWSGRHSANPGQFGNTEPKEFVEWHKIMGVNVIQTFCVSLNGYAWYKDGVVPAQPGLKHDFLPEVVKLGHAEGMKVMGYYTIGCNPRWGKENPELVYPAKKPGYHIPYTDQYLDYLSKSIADAVTKTGVDGFMVDWIWQPKRSGGKWIEAEKKLYTQLMEEQFPGEEVLTEKSEKYIEYSRKAIDRCWKTIHKAAKEANPNCIIWVTVNVIDHPHVINSDMYKQADWLMNEAGDIQGVNKVKEMVGKHTHLLTCLARWNGKDPTKVVPEALANGIGLYGFSIPDGKKPQELLELLSKPVSELKGDQKNIAVLARAYHGVSLNAIWKGEKFVEP